MNRSITAVGIWESGREAPHLRRAIFGLGECLVLSLILSLLPLNASGQAAMYSSGFRQIARGTTLTTKTVQGVKKYILVVPPGKLEEPLTIKGQKPKEERIVLKDDEKTKAFIAAAGKEPTNTTFAVIVELNGSSGAYSGSVIEFQKEKKETPKEKEESKAKK